MYCDNQLSSALDDVNEQYRENASSMQMCNVHASDQLTMPIVSLVRSERHELDMCYALIMRRCPWYVDDGGLNPFEYYDCIL
jgi:hypothetical protein